MPSHVACPHCGQLVVLNENVSSQVATCPACSRLFQMPDYEPMQGEVAGKFLKQLSVDDGSEGTFLELLSNEHGSKAGESWPNRQALARSDSIRTLNKAIWVLCVLACLFFGIALTISSNRRPSNKYIPGLAAADVHANYTKLGFKLTRDFNDPEQSIWNCVKETIGDDVKVDVFGASPTRITLVRMIYINNSGGDTDERGAQYLEYAATIRYDGSQPEKARTWVKRNIGKDATTTIGGVSFELIAAAPRVRTLLMQPVGDK
jgi:hypothetical protein